MYAPEFSKFTGVRPFLVGLFISNLSTEITAVALPLIALTILGASDQEIVLLSLIESIFMIIFLLPLGLIADRRNRRSILVGANVITAILLFCVPVLYVMGVLSLVWIVVVALGIRILGSAFDNASFTVIPRLVPNRMLDGANGAYGSVRSVAELSGSGFGAVILHTLGLTVLLVGNGLLAIVSALFLWRLPREKMEPLAEDKETHDNNDESISYSWSTSVKDSFTEATAGLRLILHDARLKRIIGSSLTSNMFATLLGVTEIIYLVRNLEVPTWAVGLLFSIPAVGGIVGGLLVGWMGRTFGSVRMILITQVVLAAPILLLPFASSGFGVSLYIVAWFFYSLSSVVYGASVASMTQRIIHDEFRGRVSAAGSWLNAIGLALSGTVAAFLVEPLGARTLVFIGSAGVYLSVVWLIHPMFTVRSLSSSEIS